MTRLIPILLLALNNFAYSSTLLPPTANRSYIDLVSFPVKAILDIPAFLHKISPLNNPKNTLFLTGLTGLLVYEDQKIIDASQKFSTRIHLIGSEDDGRQTTVVASAQVFGIGADLHLPRSPNTYLYYLGDGITTFAIAGGLLGYSLLFDDPRSFSVTSQILEAVALTGIFVVTGKMSTGRESPFRASEPGGKWRGFMGFKNYLADVSKHDAFPSGHIATAMATVRVLAENYLEKAWIKPVGYSCMGLLMFAMLNNGVHWASDYPLGIAIGYNAASVVLDKNPLTQTAHNGAGGDFQIFSRGNSLYMEKTWVL